VNLSETIKLIPGYNPHDQAGDCVFDEKAAQHALDFFTECLTHIEGAKAGTPFLLEPWQVAIVANLFGWKKPDGTRRYRTAFIYVPRKSGKSPLAAGLCLYALMCDKERGAQIYSAAADKEQAAIVYRHARGMAEASSTISKRVKIFKSIGQRAIVLKSDPASAYVVISADAKTKHGGNSHFVVIDELHAQPDRELVDVLDTSMASANRKQPMMIYITTADYDRESICNEKYFRACNVRDNGGNKLKPGYDPSFLPVIYETAKDSDWTNPDVWAACNPNLGISVSREYLEQACKEAQEIPGKQNAFKRLHLNLRTQSDILWLPIDAWDECAGKVSKKKLLQTPCHGGLDMATTTDIAAFVLVFPEKDTWKVLSMFWIPEESMHARVRRDRVPYDEWVKAGYIKTTPGNVVDYDRVKKDILKAHEDYCIIDIAVDPWNSTQLQTQLASEGLEIIKYPQGFSMFTAPAKELEKRILSRTLSHAGNPVLRWMAQNVCILDDGEGNIRPDKKKSREKIDGIVALLMAMGRALVSDGEGDYEIEKR